MIKNKIEFHESSMTVIERQKPAFVCHMRASEVLVFRFLVEACGYLSQHLDTEGLFRKTGSLSRIRALRVNSFKSVIYHNSIQVISYHSTYVVVRVKFIQLAYFLF